MSTKKTEVPAPAIETKKKIEKTPLDNFLIKNDVLLMLYSKSKSGDFYFSITPEDEIEIYNLLKKRNPKKKSLLIFLDTPGGNVYSAVKIMNMLREYYQNITIGVAQEAKSSGTMMCLGANNIIMSNASELGPLDKPLPHPNDETSIISALDIVRSLDTIIDIASVKQEKLAQELINNFRIRQDRALEISGDSISELISPLLCKEDSKVYNQAMRLLKMGEVYGRTFLTKYGHSWITKESLRTRITDSVLRKIIWDYPDHNFAICRDEVQEELFLLVENSEQKKYWPELWSKFERTVGIKGKVIKFL